MSNDSFLLRTRNSFFSEISMFMVSFKNINLKNQQL